jgi:hypothetical protein
MQSIWPELRGMIDVTCMVRRRTARRIGATRNSLRKCHELIVFTPDVAVDLFSVDRFVEEREHVLSFILQRLEAVPVSQTSLLAGLLADCSELRAESVPKPEARSPVWEAETSRPRCVPVSSPERDRRCLSRRHPAYLQLYSGK